jgi:nucleotide-binding universal stress UspA family protein
MFRTIVVGVRDVEAGRDAIALAARLRAPEDAVALLHVEVVTGRPAPDSGAVVGATKRLTSLDRLTQLADEFAIEAEVAYIEAPSVRHGLHEFVRSRNADQLVVRASHLDELGRDFVGDDTKAVLEDAPCAVAVAPAGYFARARPITRIGVAYDGSAGSEQALALARKLAAERGAELSAFEAVSAPPYAHDPTNISREWGQRAAAARQRIAGLGGLEPDARTGDPVEELGRYERSVDLLVIGAHKYGPIDQLLGGSTSQQLADDPSVPLLVLPVPSVADRRAPAIRRR